MLELRFAAGILTLAAGCGAARPPEVNRATSVAVRDSLSDRLNAAKLADTLTAILTAGVRDSAFPGAVALVGTKTAIALVASAGGLDWSASPTPTSSTLWDLASLTKVVGLTSAMMLLVESGQVDLDAPVQRYLPEFAGRVEGRGHRSPAAHALERTACVATALQGSRKARQRRWRSPSPRRSTRCRACGWSTATWARSSLGQIVARVTGQPLDAFLQRARVRRR